MRFSLIKEISQRGNIKHFLTRLQGLRLNGSISKIGSEYGEVTDLEIMPVDSDVLCEIWIKVTPVDIWNKDRELEKNIEQQTARGELLEPGPGKRLDALLPLWNEKNYYCASVVEVVQQKIYVRISEESPDHVIIRFLNPNLNHAPLRPIAYALIEAMARSPESSVVTVSEPGEDRDDLEAQLRRAFPKPMTEKRRIRLKQLIQVYRQSGHFLTQEQMAEQFGVSIDTIKDDLRLLKKGEFIKTSAKTSP